MMLVLLGSVLPGAGVVLLVEEPRGCAPALASGEVPYVGSSTARAQIAEQRRTVIPAPPGTLLIMHPYRKIRCSPPFNHY